MSCEWANQIEAYHDGELPAEQLAAVEAHLASCADCTELLEELRGLTRMIAAAQTADVPADVMDRLRSARYVLPDAGVLKIAGWLTAAAAAILFAGLIYFPRQHDDSVASAVVPTEELDTVAVTPPVGNEHNELVALAQWMADDLSGNETH